MNRLHRLARPAFLLLLLSFAHDARAAEPGSTTTALPPLGKDAYAFFEAGSQAYLKGEYRAAIEAFTWAYRISQRPGLLFSLGQTHWRAFLGNNDAFYMRRAMNCYRGYLSAQPQGPRRKEAEHAIEVLLPLEARLPPPSEPPPATCIDPVEVPSPSAPATPPSESTVPESGSGTWLMVSTNTPKAVFTLDDQTDVEMPYIEHVSAGPHVLKVKAEGYEVATKRVVVPEGAALAVTFELKEVPARLEVLAPEGSEVFIDGERRGEAPSFSTSVASGEHHLAVRLRGRKLATRQLRLEPGKTYRVSVPLETTFSRHWAHGLAVASGAAALTTTVLTGFAYERQSKADALFAKHERGELSPQERDTYARVVHQRNDLRTVALTSAIGTVALGSTALFLWIFEPLPAIERVEPASPRRERGPEWSTSLSFDGQSWAASAIARF